MISRAINGYFQNLQDIFNGYQIKFDTLYTPQIDDYKQAMNNYNLRQMYNFDLLKSIKLTEQDIEKLNNKSYNVLQYKYNPPSKADTTLANNTIYEIIYTIENPNKPNQKVTKKEAINGKPLSQNISGHRTTKEASNEIEAILEQEFIEYQKSLSITNPQRVMQNTIHKTISFNTTPELSNDQLETLHIKRYGFYADIQLECRFVTSSTNTFEQFIILYNILFHKLNPPAYITAKEWGQRKYPIRTSYQPISSAQQIDMNQKGTLLEISFNVTLSVMLMSNFFKKPSFINHTDIFIEARNNEK